MEKFAIDLDKVLDDFELQEDQAEQNVKHETTLAGVKCNGTDITIKSGVLNGNFHGVSQMKDLNEAISSFPSLPLSHKVPVLPNKPSSTEEIIPELHPTITSLDASAIEQTVVITNEHQPETENAEVSLNAPDLVNTNPNELLLDLSDPLAIPEVTTDDKSSALVADIPTLLDQSFTEDVVNQPLLSGMIANGSFNPSQPDSLTEDELLNYLAELENEKDEVDNQQWITGKPSEDVVAYCLAENQEELKSHTATNLLDIVESISVTLSNSDSHHKVTLEDDLSQFSNILTEGEVEDVSQIIEESGEESDTETSDSQPEENGSSSGDDEMPQLIDDPSIVAADSIGGTEEEKGVVQVEQLEETTPVIDERIHEELETEQSIQVEAVVDQEAEVVEEIPEALSVNAESVLLESEENLSAAATGSSVDVPTGETEASYQQENLEPYSSLTEDEQLLGVLKPIWIPDEEAPACMNCSQRFTVLRRRHHCRACGRVLCSACCSSRANLEYMESKDARVCLPCLQVLKKVEAYKKWGGMGEPTNSAVENGSQSSQDSTPTSSPSPHLPTSTTRVNPNNPSEYCSTVPPALQVAAAASLPLPTVMVPVGVLKKEGSVPHTRTRSEPKQVVFSDGIRPGGDLAELDAWRSPASEAQGHRVVPRRVPKPVMVASASKSDAIGVIKKQLKTVCPTLPPIVDGPDSIEKLSQIFVDPSASPVVFALQPSYISSNGTSHIDPHLLLVQVKLLSLDCCVRRKCWSFTTNGMRWVAQDEIVILLEQEPIASEEGSADEALPPSDVFYHLLSIYEDAMNKHHVIVNLGHTVTPGTFLGSTEHGGFLFIRTTFQCVKQLLLPSPPYLVGILLNRWEIPWAKVFPLRLLLRLGAEFRYYPCPLFSVRKRKSVYGEIGHTVINLLADMRNFNYSLPAVTGLVVHMEDRETNILMPKSRYQQVCKALAQSNDHVISLAASFSPQADAHLVCLQLDDGSYQTQAINIHTRPRKVTGASFLVLNGALKSSSGLSGRSSIVEDGVMVQLLPDKLEALKQSLIRMEDYKIVCGKVANEQPEETVTLKWVDQEPSLVNTGVISPIDGRCLAGISSIRVMQPRDYKGEGHRLLRWTELFILQTADATRSNSGSRIEDNGDITRFAEGLAKAASQALAVKLAALDPHSLVGLRVSLDGDSVEYQTGADQKPIPNICIEELDSSLIPLLHRESAAQSVSCVIEMWFQVMHP